MPVNRIRHTPVKHRKKQEQRQNLIVRGTGFGCLTYNMPLLVVLAEHIEIYKEKQPAI